MIPNGTGSENKGEGKLRRHIKLLKQEEIEFRYVREYLALAFNAARSA
ncbi:MAG: hypothetical protein WCH30_07350 [Chlorobiaceae bacterium]